MRNQKPYNVSNTFGGASGRMGEKWEEERAKGERGERREAGDTIMKGLVCHFVHIIRRVREGAEQKMWAKGDERRDKGVGVTDEQTDCKGQ